MKNRRKFTRIPMGLADATVTFDDCSQQGSLVDESINGIKVTNLRLFSLAQGKRADIQYRDDHFTGYARTLKREEDGTFSVGFERKTKSSENPQSKAMLLNCFLKHGNVEVACIPMKRCGEKLRIQLWNGHEFLANESELVSKTRLERFSELRTNHHLGELVELYGITNFGATGPNLELIFNFEFGQIDNCPTKTGRLLV